MDHDTSVCGDFLFWYWSIILFYFFLCDVVSSLAPRPCKSHVAQVRHITHVRNTRHSPWTRGRSWRPAAGCPQPRVRTPSQSIAEELISGTQHDGGLEEHQRVTCVLVRGQAMERRLRVCGVQRRARDTRPRAHVGNLLSKARAQRIERERMNGVRWWARWRIRRRHWWWCRWRCKAPLCLEAYGVRRRTADASDLRHASPRGLRPRAARRLSVVLYAQHTFVRGGHVAPGAVGVVKVLLPEVDALLQATRWTRRRRCLRWCRRRCWRGRWRRRRRWHRRWPG